jgi:hypothetical protein
MNMHNKSENMATEVVMICFKLQGQNISLVSNHIFGQRHKMLLQIS